MIYPAYGELDRSIADLSDEAGEDDLLLAECPLSVIAETRL